jgi:hypothetical protein
MGKGPTIYDLGDATVLRGRASGEPGEKLRLLYRHAIAHPALKWAILRWCRHPGIRPEHTRALQTMLRCAMTSGLEDWKNPSWLDATFAPLAELMDRVPQVRFQQRQPLRDCPALPSETELHRGLETVLKDIFRVWDHQPGNPWFPVAAQVVLSGDDPMDGENFRSVLSGLGSIEYQAIFVLFSLARCFIMENPRLRHWMVRAPFQGVCEPMYQRVGWIWHRTAYYDAIFFDHLLIYLEKGEPTEAEREKILGILENLVRFNVVTSREPSRAPKSRTPHPAITCLPKDEQGTPLCHMSDADWERKARLGFSDFVPDVDTTFLTLSMAGKWLRLNRTAESTADPALLRECEVLLHHPWPEIIGEYQVNGGSEPNPPTIRISKPLDYTGAVPIWFDKPFPKPDGRVLREALGNEICPGHNMDILESLLTNRHRWHSLEGDRLRVVQGFLDFHHRAFTSGNALKETAYIYYLPEINMYYAGRVYAVYETLTPEERQAFDPTEKMERIRKIALDFCRHNLLAETFNAFDAALAVAALCLLRDDEPGFPALARGLRLLLNAAGEGPKGHPYRAYEWNKMRHPTRILVGSESSTSLFVLNALAEARHFLDRRY